VDEEGDKGYYREYSPSLKSYSKPDSYGQYKVSWGVHDASTGRLYCAHADSIEQGKHNADKLAFLYTLEKLLYGKHLTDRIESLN
jgi:hypothetical protein